MLNMHPSIQTNQLDADISTGIFKLTTCMCSGLGNEHV